MRADGREALENDARIARGQAEKLRSGVVWVDPRIGTAEDAAARMERIARVLEARS
jgi:hypothetical protein